MLGSSVTTSVDEAIFILEYNTFMNTYLFEVQLNTSQSILTRTDGPASEFSIKEYTFKTSGLTFDERPGHRYYASRTVEADDMFTAYDIFMKRLMKITDSVAYFYSQPVSVEYWNLLIKKTGDRTAYFSAHRLIPATSMTDYDAIDDRLNDLIDKCEANEELENSVWIYNNIAKLDGVDHDPSSHQFGLCQLVESLADKDEVPLCETCRQGGYERTSRRDMKNMLGDGLYRKLYGGGDILRNRLSHGRLVGVSFLNDQDVEDAILKTTQRLNEKYEVSNKVSQEMTDRIRGTMRWYGTAYGIQHNNMGLEECLDVQFDDQRSHVQRPVPKGW